MKNLEEIKNQIMELGEVIAAVVIKHNDPAADEISERKAKLKFGATWIAYYEQKNLIKWRRKGVHRNSPKVTSYAELKALKEAEQLQTQTILKQTKK